MHTEFTALALVLLAAVLHAARNAVVKCATGPRWRVENGIAEAVKFFHLNALSSPILTKLHFDVILTMMAGTLYSMLAQKLRGFEDCHAPKLYRHFVRGKATAIVKDGRVHVTYPRRAHNPILRAVPWPRLPRALPALRGAELTLSFS